MQECLLFLDYHYACNLMRRTVLPSMVQLQRCISSVVLPRRHIPEHKRATQHSTHAVAETKVLLA
jgi:hypothetical protein